MDFSIQVEEKNKTPIVRVQGEIDIYNCHKLNKTLNQILEKKPNRFVLDLENIQYIDSTGLGVIAHAAKILMMTNGKINVICIKPQVKKIFEISGLSKKNIQLFEEETLALGA